MPKRQRALKLESTEHSVTEVAVEARAKAIKEAVAAASSSDAAAAASAAAETEAAVSKRNVYNKEVLAAKLAAIEPSPPLDWEERLDISSAAALELDDADDDLDREKAFYAQAYAAVITARAEFERRGVPHMRPDDFFAEMLKSDAHMLRVRGKLLAEKERMEAVESRKKAQESRRFARQVQAEKERERVAERKAQTDAVTAWRKQRGKTDGSSGGAVDRGAGLDKVLAATGKAAILEARSRGAAGVRPRSASRKKQAKDGKYGFGGKKRAEKSNDSSSASDTSGFSAKRNRSLPDGMTMRKGGGPKRSAKGAGPTRMGKDARSRARR